MSKKDSHGTFSDTKPIIHTKEELQAIEKYAAERGVKFSLLERFDGDMEVLRDQIDAISEIRNEYGMTDAKPMIVTFSDLSTGDLAMTNREGDVITFDRSVLRDRKKTTDYLNADNYLATSDIKGIAYHEMGHVISKRYGERGLEIVQQAYYNVYKKHLSYQAILDHLHNNVSGYSDYITEDKIDRPFKTKFYKEVTPELLSKDKTNPSELTNEFVRLIKEVYRI